MQCSDLPLHAEEFYLVLIVREQETNKDVYLDRGQVGI